MAKMRIENFEDYSSKLEQILDTFKEFCESLEFHKNHEDEMIREDVEMRISNIKKIKTTTTTTNKHEHNLTVEKALAYLPQNSIYFLKTEKVKGDFPISNKFLSNKIAIFENKNTIHHSHVTGEIIGYEHNFCNQKAKENYYTIPVFAHNQF